MEDCIFCKIGAGEIKADVVWEDERSIAFRDLNPQAPTHVLVIPREHIRSVAQAEKSQASLLGHLLYVTARVAEELGLNSEFRVVANSGSTAGQSVFHLHFHLLGGRRMGWPPG